MQTQIDTLEQEPGPPGPPGPEGPQGIPGADGIGGEEATQMIEELEQEVESLEAKVEELEDIVLLFTTYHPYGYTFIIQPRPAYIPEGSSYQYDIDLGYFILQRAVAGGATYTWDGVTSEPMPVTSSGIQFSVTASGQVGSNVFLTVTVSEFWYEGYYYQESQDSVIAIVASPTDTPLGSLSWDPETPETGEEVTFTVDMTDVNDYNLYASLQFSEGSVFQATGWVAGTGTQQLTWTYPDPGVYTITVVLENQWTIQTVLTYTITVNEPSP
jgi:hypothetical protein